MSRPTSYVPKHPIRILTAASLFDGHDAAINIMRRILQASGAEIIHLGHNRSAGEIVQAAIQEDVQAIALTSYQGGHMEYFTYIYDLLQEAGCGHIRLFGGGGGTILPAEIEALHAHGITRIYSPDDGRTMGLQGMIDDLLQQADFPTTQLEVARWKQAIKEAYGPESLSVEGGGIATNIRKRISARALGRLISAIESETAEAGAIMKEVHLRLKGLAQPPVLGITGTGGAGKSSLVDEFLRRFLHDFPDRYVAVVSVDPSRRRSGGALLGDRIRMNTLRHPNIYMRSLATRQAHRVLPESIPEILSVLKAAQFDLIILETSGIGQSGTEIVDVADLSLYIMTPEYGAASQLEKIDMLDYADLIALNKYDKRGAQDALRDVKKQVQRNQGRWDASPDEMPVFGTIASQFNDPGTHRLYRAILDQLQERTHFQFPSSLAIDDVPSEKIHIIPPKRVRYLAEISEQVRAYNQKVEAQATMAQQLYSLHTSIRLLEEEGQDTPTTALEVLRNRFQETANQLAPGYQELIEGWEAERARYQAATFQYQVRGKTLEVETSHQSLSNTRIPKIALPRFQAWGDVLRWLLQENVPGNFPYTAGVFPFKRQGEDPTRMFAGEGGPERTNRRFHYLSYGMPAKRLSTAFDSVTLYGEDPAFRPDIYGKVGNSGVSICCLDDAKKLYSGFDLCDPSTSVSMTINGPAANILAFFLNAAIDQQCERYLVEHGLQANVEARLVALYDEQGLPRPTYTGELPKGNDGLGLMLLGLTGDQVLEPEVYASIKAQTLGRVRGTVQADILKEDQAQNTCIFSTEYSLRLQGDVQQYFIDQKVRNFYSVSISGYHIAEAGANPISQLAFTLANGFTFVEYYLARGMDVNDFAPNFSFFFSNGLDPEYAVIGRVARRIWAKAMKFRYGANERAQKLKYHIQTSGRSLHAQEIGFNDIRTTLQALYAIYDNCNSLHTNAYDEAITTPTEESVRRAMAIQLIINRELGLSKNENPNQGSFIIEELTDLVEEAVLMEFDRLTERGGVLGAMETMYQRSKIQEESLYYESLKHSGALPIIGVNTFLSDEGSPTVLPREVIRATPSEKNDQIEQVAQLHQREAGRAKEGFDHLRDIASGNGNLFEALMEISKYATLGQITHAMFDLGGEYRRNM